LHKYGYFKKKKHFWTFSDWSQSYKRNCVLKNIYSISTKFLSGMFIISITNSISSQEGITFRIGPWFLTN
jgi:hypothetical protein